MAWVTELPNVNPYMTTQVNPTWSFGGATGTVSVPTTGQLWPR